jgi:hypothetical protein
LFDQQRNSARMDLQQLDDLLFDRRKYPWTKDEFISYLKTVYSEESFEFLLEIERLRKISSKEQLIIESSRVFDIYVKQGAERQINVSSSVISAAEIAFKQDPCNIELIYGDIYREAKSLIISGMHIPKFNDYVTHTLNDHYADQRIYVCVILFLVALVASVLLIVFFQNENFWIRFASVPFWYIFSAFTAFRFKRMCPVAAFLKLRVNSSGKVFKLEDDQMICKVRKTSRWLHLITILATCAFVAIVVNIPFFSI